MCHHNDRDLYICMASWLCEEYGKLLYFIIYLLYSLWVFL